MKTNLSRILLLGLALTLLSFVTGCGYIYDRLGGPYWGKPADIFDDDVLLKHDEEIVKHAKELINQAFERLEEDKGVIADYHVHFFGKREQEKNVFCPSMDDIDVSLRPMTNLKRIIKSQKLWMRPFFKGIFMDTTCVTDENRMNEQYMERLIDLVYYFGPPKHAQIPDQSPYRAVFYLMGMDGEYKQDGKLDELSYNYVSNKYIVELVDCLNKKIKESNGFIKKGFAKNEFKAVGSINPMRFNGKGNKYVMRDKEDWLNEINFLKTNNVGFIKWRTPTMGFDPDEVSNDFYKELKESEIGILTHTGVSKGIGVDDYLNQYAGPRRMDKAVNNGVKVVLLHMGRKGVNCVTKEKFSDEFVEFLKESLGTTNQLFGEMAALPYDDTHPIIKNIINAERDFVNRIVNGSDYAAVSPYILVWSSLKKLEKDGYISEKDQSALDLIYHYNPLLFDFVLKRTICIGGKKIPDSVFLDMSERQ